MLIIQKLGKHKLSFNTNNDVLVGTRDDRTQSARACKAQHGTGKKLGVQRRPQRTPYSQEESLQHLAVDHITGINTSRGPS
jgi:hypothetical protein